MDERIQAHLRVDDDALEADWTRIRHWIEARFHRESSIEAILFLIGVQSRGRGYEPEVEKEIKQDLIMEGTFCAFEELGLYDRVGLDEDGFWIWERRVAEIPKLPLEDQEKLIKLGIVHYFGAYELGSPD